MLSAPFDMGLLERISEVRDVRVNLGRLESRLLMRRLSESGQWEFSHSLIENVAYTSMLQARQKLLHLRIAEMLEHQYAGDVTRTRRDPGLSLLKYGSQCQSGDLPGISWRESRESIRQ